MAQVAECPNCGVLIDLRRYSNAVTSLIKQCPYCWAALIEEKIKLYNLVPANEASLFNANDIEYLAKMRIKTDE